MKNMEYLGQLQDQQPGQLQYSTLKRKKEICPLFYFVLFLDSLWYNLITNETDYVNVCLYLLQMLQTFPLCQWVLLLRLWRAIWWLWTVAVLLSQQLPIPGPRGTKHCIIKNSLSSITSSPQTLESITAQLRTSWGGHPITSLLMWNVSII